ncbi:MAG TPA: aldehyde dehydrogenase family protein [Acidimicrobiales bacterium]|nr:aldehyde dehydrogenase family protein [Acidimicrobiales bacterium]
MNRRRYDPAWVARDPYPQLIGGVEMREGKISPVIDPSTGEEVASWAEATEHEIDAAVSGARASYDAGLWSKMPLARRAEVLEAVAERIRREAPRLAAVEALDTGKAVTGALAYDVFEAATAFAHAAGMCRDLHGDVRRSSFPPDLIPGGGPEILTLRLREPGGVVCELLPWNGPLMTGSQRLSAALAAGCSIVVKAPTDAVMSVVTIAGMLHEAGLPPGVLNVVLGPGATVGERLVDDPRFDIVSLTGSVETGRRVMEIASRHLTAVHLELGGKSPVLVFADADLDQAVGWATMAAFVNMGEVCVAGSRLLVEESVYNDVVKAVAAAAATLPIGDALAPATFIGPLVSAGHADRVRGYLDRALAAGDAELVGAPSVPVGSRETFVPPTVLGRVRHGSEIEQEEVFGPVLAAMPFSTPEEAVELANGTRYGLNATVFSRDIERVFTIADLLDCGEVNVNCHFAPDMNGGRGEPRRLSGLSRTGVEAYTRLKAVNLQVRS